MNRYENAPDFGAEENLMRRIPRVAAIHDVSCLGRCALTVIMPVMSALGVQVVPLPTALLSTHTGGFENMYFEDLTDRMKKIASHWKSIGTDFDAIYSGFLGSEEQIELLRGFIRDFERTNDGKKTFIAVDPVMGDDGMLYSTYTRGLVLGMGKLCEGADLITPNLTEVCCLTGTPFPSAFPENEKEAKELALSLAEKVKNIYACRRAVITGIEIHGGGKSVMTAAFDFSGVASVENASGAEFNDGMGNGGATVQADAETFHTIPLLPRSYPGTGDVFASILIGKLLGGEDFGGSVKAACDFVSLATEKSSHYATPIRDGLVFEPYIEEICKR